VSSILSPTYELGGPFHEDMGSHIFSSFFAFELSSFLFSNIIFWNGVDPLELSDYFGQ
jgi:hypothetical protein